MKRIGRPLIKLSANTQLYETSVAQLRSRLKRWYQNRPEDLNRVNEIKEVLETETVVDGIIHAWDPTGDGQTLLVFDGWTRLSAAMRVKHDIRILLAITVTRDESMIVNYFNRLNKAVPLPVLYADQSAVQNMKRRILLEDVTAALVKKNKVLVSTARKPRVPNFNRDGAFELLDNCLPQRDDLTKEQVLQVIDSLNTELLADEQAAWSDKAKRAKCVMFCADESYIKQFFARAIDANNKATPEQDAVPEPEQVQKSLPLSSDPPIDNTWTTLQSIDEPNVN